MIESDLIVIGGGPAGLSAAANAAAEGLETSLLEARERLGGQAAVSSRIENYLGFPEGISGAELAAHGERQAARLGAELETGRRVAELSPDGDTWRVTCESGQEYGARAVLLAPGVDWRRLDVPGEDFGVVRYGATPAELTEYAGRHIAIVGAANSAGQAALYAASQSVRVTLLARRTLEAAMSAYLVARIQRHPRIRALESVNVTAVMARDDGAVLALDGAGAAAVGGRLEAAAVLVYIGARPAVAFAADYCARDRAGFVRTLPGSYAADGAPGLFVAGDCRAGARKRVATAAGEGATATAEIYGYVREGINA